ncbi:glycosyltransferase [Staphylococcus sp. KG4-1]|nr:glycosyltransferase [Staphylococcus sp. KG4-3]MDW8544447.1 glycosyltransferase [Staphylococcus sp. KG4-1]MDW8560797.1 glycosyltransferase [Staphylococcus sp. KG4-3]
MKEIDPEITFHIYGEGDYKDEILKMIDEKNLNSTVKLFGYTDNPYKTIKGFRSVISTSQSEAQGLSMIEAMANGVPVVAFDIKYGPSQFIKDKINGYLIENKNVDAMATAIIELMNNDSKSISFGENARKEIVESFEPINLINQWKNLFDK